MCERHTDYLAWLWSSSDVSCLSSIGLPLRPTRNDPPSDQVPLNWAALQQERRSAWNHQAATLRRRTLGRLIVHRLSDLWPSQQQLLGQSCHESGLSRRRRCARGRKPASVRSTRREDRCWVGSRRPRKPASPEPGWQGRSHAEGCRVGRRRRCPGLFLLLEPGQTGVAAMQQPAATQPPAPALEASAAVPAAPQRQRHTAGVASFGWPAL